MQKTVIAFIAGLLVGGFLTYWFLPEEPSWDQQIINGGSDEYHTHADFLVVINDEVLDFTQEKYQSRLGTIKDPDVHLHDNQGDIIHTHAEGVSMNQFLNSIGFMLTPSCLVTDSTQRFCVDESNALTLYVNGEPVEQPGDYVPLDNDRILLYYGPDNMTTVTNYLDSVTDEACIYSGTCPERGVAPPEECGLTCEL